MDRYNIKKIFDGFDAYNNECNLTSDFFYFKEFDKNLFIFYMNEVFGPNSIVANNAKIKVLKVHGINNLFVKITGRIEYSSSSYKEWDSESWESSYTENVKANEMYFLAEESQINSIVSDGCCKYIHIGR